MAGNVAYIPYTALLLIGMNEKTMNALFMVFFVGSGIWIVKNRVDVVKDEIDVVKKWLRVVKILMDVVKVDIARHIQVEIPIVKAVEQSEQPQSTHFPLKVSWEAHN